MELDTEEYQLLAYISKWIDKRLGPVDIYGFTASFRSDGWVARMDYTPDGSKEMKSLLIEGSGKRVENTIAMKPRCFHERGSIAKLRQGLLELEMESPPCGEREA